jgi:acyl-CoA thioesterase FadM
MSGSDIPAGELDSYDWFHDVSIGPEDFDELDHIGNAAVARMLDEARTAWFRTLEGREPGRAVVVRHVSISYEREGRRGVEPRCGVRAVSRTRRSLLITQMLFDPTDKSVLARGEAVHVCFEAASRTVVAVWPALLVGVERRQGAPLPLVERPSAAGGG